jgi:hypothetical protein
LPSAKPAGWLVLLQPLAELQEAVEVARDGVEAGLVHPGLAVDDAAGRGAERHRDPAAVVLGLAVLLGEVVPAAVLLAEVGRHVRQVDALGGELVRVVGPGVDDVGTAADVGRDRRLRPQVAPGLGVDPHRDAVLLAELLGVLEEQRLVALHELGRAQHAQGGTLLDREAGRLDVGCLDLRAGRPAEPSTEAPASAPTPALIVSRRLN